MPLPPEIPSRNERAVQPSPSGLCAGDQAGRIVSFAGYHGTSLGVAKAFCKRGTVAFVASTEH